MKNRQLVFGLCVLMVFAIISNTGICAKATDDVNKLFNTLKTSSFDPKAMVRFLPYNVSSWYARWHILQNAKKSIDVTYFIVEKDIFGMSLLGMLMKKAKEGVKIRIMMDARGTKGLIRKLQGGDLLQELAKFDNVKIRVFNPVTKKLLAAFRDIRKLTASNHDKMILVDAEYLITGGRNISKNYFVDPRDIDTVYRDSDVVIKSKIVARQAIKAFEEEFNSNSNTQVAKELFGNIDNMSHHLTLAYYSMNRYLMGRGLAKINKKKMSAKYISMLTKYNNELKEYKHLPGYSSFRLFEGQHPAAVRLVDKHSFNSKKNDITSAVVAMMDKCKKEIIIQNPYVVLTPKARAAMKRASDRGVKIIVHTNSPKSSDSLLTQALFLGDWKQALKDMPNMRIFALDITRKLHSKVFVFDRKIAVVGTYNMDYVSEQINSEVIAMIKYAPFANRVALRVHEDMKSSVEYKIKVKRDGSIVTVFGPKSHSDPKAIKKLQWLMKLQWLRPLI